MRPDLAGDVQGALVVFGGALQFLRASRKVSDWFTLFFGAGTAIGVWVLAVDWGAVKADIPAFVLQSIPTIAGCIGAVMGGTFMASKAANSAKGTSAEGHPLIPATDTH